MEGQPLTTITILWMVECIYHFQNFTSPEERKACATRAMNKSTDPNIKKSLSILVTTGIIPKTKDKFENCLKNSQNIKNEELIKKIWKAFIAEAEIVDTRETNHPRDLDAPKKRRRDLDAPPKDMELRLENFSIPKKKVESPPKKRVRFADVSFKICLAGSRHVVRG